MLRRCVLAVLATLAGCGPDGPDGSHGRASIPSPAAVRPFRIAAPDLVLLITGGTNGMLEVCNCAGPMPGGLARRSGLVHSYRAAFPNTFLLDAGDAFWVAPDDLRNDFLFGGYGQIGYDAVVLGDQEWAAGADRLRKLQAAAALTCLSTSIAADTLDNPRAVLRDLHGVKLAVVSDVPKEAFRFVPPERVRGLSFSGRAEVAARVGSLRSEGFVVVLVAHMDDEALEAAAGLYEADLIVRGHTSRSDPQLRHAAGKPVVKVGGSDTVGVVAMKVRHGRLLDLDYRVEVVDTSWPLDRRLLQTYQAYAHAAMREALDAERKEGLDYLAPGACGHCHRPQYDFWRKTRHARAYGTLVKVGRTGDPSCLMCHTSGFGTKTGFYTLQKTPRLANVNCQDCHRFNDLEHRQQGYLFEPVGKDVCTTCHTPVTDPKFDYGGKLPKVRCPHSPRPSRSLQPLRADAPAGTDPNGP